VTITAQAPAINTEGADKLPALSPVQLANIPWAGRDVMRCFGCYLAWAVCRWGAWGEIGANDLPGNASNGGQFAVSRRTSAVPACSGITVLVDGQVGSNPDFPGLFMAAISMDAVSEAKIIFAQITPPSTDGIRVRPSAWSLKSGTSQFHGSVYTYMRHEEFNAQRFPSIIATAFLNPYSALARLAWRLADQCTFLVTSNRDRKKLFFFFSHETWWYQTATGYHACYRSDRARARRRLLAVAESVTASCVSSLIR
jgi:hypothetical protein